MMSDAGFPSGSPSAVRGVGCVVFLVDESRAQEVRVAEGTRSKAESIATAVNSLLAQLSGSPSIDVALVGYRADAAGNQEIGCRWGGPLAGRRWVRSYSLAENPLTIENRVRKVPGPGGIGVMQEETVRFPVWYQPSLGAPGSRDAAYEFCQKLLAEWLGAVPSAVPPLVLGFLADEGRTDSLAAAAARLQQLTSQNGPPLAFHAHLGTSARVPPTLYPSNDIHLPSPIRDSFHASGQLPDVLAASLRQAQVPLNPGAHGLIYNAKMVDLIRFLSLVKTYRDWAAATAVPLVQAAAAAGPVVQATESAPGGMPPAVILVTPAAPSTPAVETPPIVADAPLPLILLLDRSVEESSLGDPKNVWRRLQERANEMLGEIAKRAKRPLELAVVSYGSGAGGGAVVQTGFVGPLAGRLWADSAELAGGAIRVDEFTEQVSNGVGGLVTMSRKQPIYVELEPTTAASPVPSFEAARQLCDAWRQAHPGNANPMVVLHLTRGRFPPGEIEAAISRLGETGAAILYHLVLTESPHRSLAYEGDPSKLDGEPLQRLWQLTSLLANREKLAAKRPSLSGQARGIVINGKFDLLMESLSDGV